MDWSTTFQQGFSDLLDGAIEKELIKERNEQVPPQGNTQSITPNQAVQGVFAQNMIVFGQPVNKGILAATALIVTLIAVVKVAR